MAVNTNHPDYEAATPRWHRCRDAYGGTDSIKATVLKGAAMSSGQPYQVTGIRTTRHANEYLPKLEGMDWTQFAQYVERALWYGATKRTVEGLSGAIFRKDPTVDVPDTLKEQLDDITMDGDVTIGEFAKQILKELLITGRCGVLVDMAAEDVAPADRRPYWVLYTAEQVINWKTMRVGGKTVLSLVVIEEEVLKEQQDDEFGQETETRYRVLKLVDGVYSVDIWAEVEKEAQDGKKLEEFEVIESYTPTNLGKALDYIPFCFFGADGLTVSIAAPPLLDLVDVNLSHYRSSADLEHGLHYTALPTPYALGFPAESQLVIGPATCWKSDSPDGKVGMLEFTGQGLKAISETIAAKEQKMAALGARLLEAQKAGVEAADTVRLRQSGEHGALQSIANTLSQGLTKACGWHAEWTGVDPDACTIEVNKDFYDADIDPVLLQTLLAALQAGTISYETFYYNLQKGEIARPGIEAEEEKGLIEADGGEFKIAPPGAESESTPPEEEGAPANG